MTENPLHYRFPDPETAQFIVADFAAWSRSFPHRSLNTAHKLNEAYKLLVALERRAQVACPEIPPFERQTLTR